MHVSEMSATYPDETSCSESLGFKTLFVVWNSGKVENGVS
jgi:hypothetical protein